MTPEDRRIKQLDELTEVEFSFDPPAPPPPVISRAMMDAFVKELLTDAKKMYDGNVCLKYHTWSHVIDVFSAYVRAFGDASPEVEAAIGFHDVVYIAGSNANEGMSARYLEVCVRRQKTFFTAQAENFDLWLAKHLIEKTAVYHHLMPRHTLMSRYPSSPKVALEVARVCDADLSSLAMPWPEFVRNQENIIIEQTGVKRKAITAEHRAQSARFLFTFLELDSIYYNAEAKALWEDRAWYNIFRWVRENNVGLLR